MNHLIVAAIIALPILVAFTGVALYDEMRGRNDEH
jgi:hypothetical protein